MVKRCSASDQPNFGRYYIYIIPHIILSILQISLFIHTAYHEIVSRNQIVFKRVRFARAIYISMHLIAIMFLCVHAMQLIIDPKNHFLRDSYGCEFIAKFVYVYVECIIECIGE